MKTEHEAFAFNVAKGMEKLQAYLNVYPNVSKPVAAAAASRLLKREDVKDEIVKRKTEIVKQADTLAATELKDERKYLFLSMADKRDILFKIAHGKMKTKTWDRNKGEYVYTYPSDDDKIKAIKLDAELTGEGFQPEKPNTEGGGNTYNNTIITRKTVFKTNVTTNRQEVPTTANE